MPTARVQKFDGGIAEDIRTFAIDECEKSLNFNILNNPHKLVPYSDSKAEVADNGDMKDVQISDVEVSLIGSNYVITGSGYESISSVKPTFYIKSDIISTFSQQAVAAGTTYQKNSGVVYKDKFYALGYNGSDTYTLYRYNSAGSVTAVGTISSSSQFFSKPFVHPEDNVLYIVIGTTITSWDGSSLTTTTSILPTGYEGVSLTDYGTYLAITMRPLRGNGSPRTYLWGRDATLNTLQGIVPWGEGKILFVENIYNTLIAIMQPQDSFHSAFYNRILAKGWAGGSVQPLKDISVGVFDFMNVIRLKNSDRIYFGNQNADDCIYVFGKNKGGSWVLTKDQYLFNGVTTYGGLAGLSMIGDIMWRLIVGTISGGYTLMRSRVLSYLSETATYLSTSVYKTTINPSMAIADRGKMKQLLAVRVYYTGKANGVVGVKYAVDTTTMTSIISESTTAIEDMKQATMQIDGNALNAGREIQFQMESTGGVEIKYLEYDYEPINQ